MNLRTEILKEHSKKQTIRLSKWIGEDKKRFEELMKLFLDEEYRMVQRSAWIIKHVADDHPEWVKPHLKMMLEYCRQPVSDAVKRNVVGILQNIPIPKDLQGLAATLCFDFLASPDEPVAVKVFSMTVLANIAMEEPDMKNELIPLIAEQMEFAKPGFRARGKKIMKMLQEKP